MEQLNHSNIYDAGGDVHWERDRGAYCRNDLHSQTCATINSCVSWPCTGKTRWANTLRALSFNFCNCLYINVSLMH